MLWDRSYEMGIKEIDEQHFRWLQITEKLLDSLIDGSLKTGVYGIFDELFDYTNYHFSYEEDVLAANHYPDLEKHKDLHRELVVRLRDIRTRLINSNYQESTGVVSGEIIELVDLCRAWLIEHIEQEDKACVAYLRPPKCCR